MKAAVLVALVLTVTVVGLLAAHGATKTPAYGPPAGTPSDWPFYVTLENVSPTPQGDPTSSP